MLPEGSGISSGLCRMNGNSDGDRSVEDIHPEEVRALRHGSREVHGGFFRTSTEPHVAGQHPSQVEERGLW